MREAIEAILALAGIEPGGTNPWDIQIHQPAWWDRVGRQRSLGLGESYMEGWWDCPQLDAFFARLLGSRAESRLKPTARMVLRALGHRLFNFQTHARARRAASHHYDLDEGLYERMLDPTMTYSCGYWKNAATLEEAQHNKMELVCAKLMLEPGMTLLDIGCGWGGLACYAASRHGARVVGVTLSEDQVRRAREVCRGLPVEIRFQDYRDLPPGTFDRVVSIGMFEHVGHRNHRAFMEAVARHLAGDGLFLLHTIGGEAAAGGPDPWIGKYIFHYGEIPTVGQVCRAAEGKFVLEDWHNFGADYDRTLMAWQRNFTARWDELKGRFDARFFRMWTYYLLACAGAFRARALQLWQVVLSRRGVPGGFLVRDLPENRAT